MKTELTRGSLTLPGLVLLRIVNDAAAALVANPQVSEAAMHDPRAIPDPRGEAIRPLIDYVRVATPQAWLRLNGHLSSYSQAVPWYPCRVYLGPDDNWTAQHVFENSLVYRRVGVGGSFFAPPYADYATVMSAIAAQVGGDHALASAVLRRVQCQTHSLNDPVHKSRVDELALLWFGVEASHNVATLATGVFLLDLIAARQTYGRRMRAFTWSTALASDYAWDVDPTSAPNRSGSYGGKFPMGQQGTGTGNIADRTALLQQVGQGQVQEATAALQAQPQHHMVARREISLIVHWLEAHPGLQGPFTGLAVLQNAVGNAVQARLAEVFLGGVPTQSLRAGVPATLPRASATDNNHAFTFPVVYWWAHGRVYHASQSCKLLPQALQSLPNPTSGTETQAQQAAKQPCEYCCSPAKRIVHGQAPSDTVRRYALFQCPLGHDTIRELGPGVRVESRPCGNQTCGATAVLVRIVAE